MTSCTPCPCWKAQELSFTPAADRSARLIFPLATDPLSQYLGLELEFLRGTYGMKGFINVKSRQTSPFMHDEKTAALAFLIDDEKHFDFCIRLEEGQRVELTDSQVALLLDAFAAQKSVTIGLDSYSAIIPNTQYKKAFARFMKTPIPS